MKKFLAIVVYSVSAQGLLPKSPSFPLDACKNAELAGRILGRLSPEFAKCFNDSLFFASALTACGKCRDAAVKTSMLFQSRCKLPTASSYVQFGVDKLQVYVNWANKANVDAVCHSEDVYEEGQYRYKYNCLQALLNADTAIDNAKAKAEVHNVDLTFTTKDMKAICNNCTKILVDQFHGRGNEIPFTYSFIPLSPPDTLLQDIAGVCDYDTKTSSQYQI
ncbi:hypothetical protein DSO57_1022527 [Entomophthora muscae]|uniref:Uncharacterized protein n=1 Tax=Entomophthora muscae TaxID=34485 RepID=A0ACC2RUH6_9FUNG|nr:hypothetical protein DSO57_1022527 [Entomophthora muscae]